MPMAAMVGLANRDAALAAIGQDPIHFKNVQPNLNNPEIKRWQAQYAAGEPITGFGDTGSFVPPSLSTSTARLNPQFFGPIPGRVQAPAPTTAPVALAPTPQPTAVNKTGSSDYRHGGTTPKKKKEEQGRGSARSALLLSGGGGKLG